MTKRRPPGSRFDAFTMACQELGYDVALDLLDLSENRLRKLGDPDADGEPTIRQCEKLDQALKERGEEPLNLIAYAGRLGERPATPQTHARLAVYEIRQIAKVIESGTGDPDGAWLEIERDMLEISRELTKLREFFLERHERAERARGVRLVGGGKGTA